MEETIRSVLLQNHPKTEFIVIDGGSRDHSVEIIKKYEKWISYWISEKDNGQSHAINKGLSKASGDWIGWQNSDDIYLRDAFSEVTKAARQTKDDVLFGHAEVIDEASRTLHTLYYAPFSFFEMKYSGWNITNQSTFFSQKVIEKHRINESLHYAMDADLYFRIADSGYKFRLINKVLGAFRTHAAAKTGTLDTELGVDEAIDLRRRYGIVQTKAPWATQFRFQKWICRLRKFYYLGLQGNLGPALSQKAANRVRKGIR